MTDFRNSVDRHFSRFSGEDAIVPVWCVSPPGRPTIHRFFDTSPISPSGRFIAMTTFSTDTALPQPGDTADVVVIDLLTGRTVFQRTTCGWDSQLGAQAQWGASDNCLLFNDLDVSTWEPFGVIADIATGYERRLDSTIYMVSHDGTEALSPCLRRIAETQEGYGVVVPASARPQRRGAVVDDGVTCVNIATGQSHLWISVRDIVNSAPQAFENVDTENGQFYVFHVKWSPDDQRVMIVLRYRPPGAVSGPQKTWLFTCDRKAGNLRLALGPDAWVGGHHPNWCPDSTNIIMNVVMPLSKTLRRRALWTLERGLARLGATKLDLGGYKLRLVSFRYDGTDMRVLSRKFLGSGHPTRHYARGDILTDSYAHERVAAGDGTVPLRWITEDGARMAHVVRMPVRTAFKGPKGQWRVDPHPAWDRKQRFVTFNGAPDGVRSVFVADFSDIVPSE